MVRVAAEPVAALAARVVAERVDHAVLVQQGDRAVDGREPDVLVAAVPQPLPERLSGRVVALACQLAEHGEPFRCGVDPLRPEQVCERG